MSPSTPPNRLHDHLVIPFKRGVREGTRLYLTLFKGMLLVLLSPLLPGLLLSRTFRCWYRAQLQKTWHEVRTSLD